MRRLALALLLLAAAGGPVGAGDATSCRQAYDAKNWTVAARECRKAAGQGHADAQIKLGFMYYMGRGVPRNYSEAAKWIRKAAEQGNAKARHNLGFMYFTGQGVPRDYGEAAKWYRKAAEQGNAKAQSNLGVLYGLGKGFPKNNVLAYMWMSLAAAQGHRSASKNLAITERRMTPAAIAKAKALAAKKHREIETRKKKAR